MSQIPIVTTHYDPKGDETIISSTRDDIHTKVPGRWTMVTFVIQSQQHLVTGPDKRLMFISFGQKYNYAFDTNGSNEKIVHNYYHWDSEHHRQLGHPCTLLVDGGDYIIWKMEEWDPANNRYQPSYFLFCLCGVTICNFMFYDPNAPQEILAVAFLEQLRDNLTERPFTRLA